MSAYISTMQHACTNNPALAVRARSLRVLPRCQSNSNNTSSTRTTTKADALAELQALRQGLGQHLANTETALKSSPATEVSAPVAEGQVLEIGSPENDLHEITAAQFDDLITSVDEDDLVMVKFTSSTCGPCKLMLPKLVAMREEFPQAHFVKIMMTSASKELGMRLNIKVAPSFLFFKGGEQVAFVTGTKERELRDVFDSHL